MNRFCHPTERYRRSIGLLKSDGDSLNLGCDFYMLLKPNFIARPRTSASTNATVEFGQAT